VKIEDVNPILKPSLLMLTPDVSDARSFISLDVELQDLFLEKGRRLKLIVSDALPVQVSFFLSLFLFSSYTGFLSYSGT
jgi:hypothetical protein